MPGYSPHISTSEQARRPVSWHESLLNRAPQREEWTSLPAPGTGRGAFQSGIQLPAIRSWRDLPQEPYEEPRLMDSPQDIQRREDRFHPMPRAAPLPVSPPSRQLPPARPDNPHRSVPVYHLLHSPRQSENPTQLVKSWPQQMPAAQSHRERSRNSPRSDLDLRAVSENRNPGARPVSPTSSRPLGRHLLREPYYRGNYEQQDSNASSYAAVQSTGATSPRSGETSNKGKQSAASLSPVQEDSGRSEMPRSTDARKPNTSAHTPPAAQYSWEAPDAAAEGSARRRRGNLPKESTAILNAWFCEHITYPYPKEEEKQRLQLETGLSMSQVSVLFSRWQDSAC